MNPRNIPYPAQHTEFEVQAWLYSALRAAGRDVRGEVKAEFEPKQRSRKATFCRFDLVEYDNGRALRIFEVTGDPGRHRAGVGATRHGPRYPQFGVPVTFVYGMSDAVLIAGQA